MKIIHQISNVWSPSQVVQLKEFGINIQVGHYVFQIEEDERYHGIIEFIRQSGASDWVGTRFDKEDLSKSNQLCIQPQWMNDYPQPLNDYLETCYNLNEYCAICGIGKVQKAPFRLKREPSWGKKQTFSLNWVFDEVFVRREYYNKILRPLGIDSLMVMLHKKDTPSESTVQLKIPVSNSGLELQDYPFEECGECGRKKYLPITRGFFPKLKSAEALPIIKSQEYFGSGAAADKRILISRDLYKILSSDKVNLAYHPTQ